MQADILISTGERTALTYFLGPLKSSFSKTFREKSIEDQSDHPPESVKLGRRRLRPALSEKQRARSAEVPVWTTDLLELQRWRHTMGPARRPDPAMIMIEAWPVHRAVPGLLRTPSGCRHLQQSASPAQIRRHRDHRLRTRLDRRTAGFRAFQRVRQGRLGIDHRPDRRKRLGRSRTNPPEIGRTKRESIATATRRPSSAANFSFMRSSATSMSALAASGAARALRGGILAKQRNDFASGHPHDPAIVIRDRSVDHVEEFIEKEDRVISPSRTQHRGMILQLDAECRDRAFDSAISSSGPDAAASPVGVSRVTVSASVGRI